MLPKGLVCSKDTVTLHEAGHISIEHWSDTGDSKGYMMHTVYPWSEKQWAFVLPFAEFELDD